MSYHYDVIFSMLLFLVLFAASYLFFSSSSDWLKNVKSVLNDVDSMERVVYIYDCKDI